MAQFTITDLLDQRDRLGLFHAAGPAESAAIERVQIVDLTTVDTLSRGTLAVIAPVGDGAAWRIDIAIRQAIARGLPALVVTADLEVAETAAVLAHQGSVPVLTAPGSNPADLAVAIDRLLAGGASEIMTRSRYAVAQATEAAGATDATVEDILLAAGQALGVTLEMVEDAGASWTENDVVCVGEVPIGRVRVASPSPTSPTSPTGPTSPAHPADPVDPAVAMALPVVAALASRTAQRHVRDRFAPAQSRGDFIIELVLADGSRLESFVGRAARLGLPLQLGHAVAWLTPTPMLDPDSDSAPPRSVAPALELFALQLMEGRPESWHIAFIQQDMLVVCTEETGAGDHQRRLRDVATQLQDYAKELTSGDWVYTLGIGTPQQGAVGLRQSAAEARVAADTAIAANRTGGVELTDGTGLRRVLLDLYASPISRTLLDDVLAPIDALGAERAATAVQTLFAYLANGNSLARAGRDLNLHPNAVGYRLKGIREALQLDLADPDTRFSVELACRVRLLRTSRR